MILSQWKSATHTHRPDKVAVFSAAVRLVAAKRYAVSNVIWRELPRRVEPRHDDLVHDCVKVRLNLGQQRCVATHVDVPAPPL
jgi:hypothetical protein